MYDAARRKDGSKADAASMETMLATRDDGKRRKKATLTASAIARPVTAKMTAMNAKETTTTDEASAETSKPKTAADFRAEFEAAKAEAKEAILLEEDRAGRRLNASERNKILATTKLTVRKNVEALVAEKSAAVEKEAKNKATLSVSLWSD